jgi:tetratricopeptide (TPR) repeat protein
VISFSALARLRREPWLATGWFWFLGTLVPVIGIVQVGTQAMADRYTYVPLIGLFVCAVWAVADFFGGRRWGTQLLTAAGVLVIAACSVMTWQQASFWKNDLTLFNHALAVTANNAVAHNIVGEALLDQGEYESANEHFRAALEADPSNAIARYDFSVALARYGFALAKAGKLEAAAQQYQASLQIRPTAQVYNSLGAVLSRLDKRDEALQQYAAALQLDPDYADGHFNFGVALALTGKIDDAVAHFQEVVRLKPDSLEARTHLAELLIRQGKFDDAVAQLEEVLRRRPGPEVYRQLAFARIMQGKIEQAVDSLEQAIHLDPNFPPALNDLAWLRATAPEARWRNGEEAVKLAEHACELTGSKQALFLGTLAAAYAEAGRFNDARKSAEQAVALATAEGNKDLAERNRQLLELYRSGKPYHEPARQ